MARRPLAKSSPKAARPRSVAVAAASPVAAQAAVHRPRNKAMQASWDDDPTLAWIGLGANLGERDAALRQAVRAIAALPGTQMRRVSSLYRSAPVEATGPDFINAVAELHSTLPPLALLRELHNVTGGGTYLTRALACRNETGADVIVFMLPHGENTIKNVERIKRGREDLMSAVKPLILPFKIVVVIGSNRSALENYYKDMAWSDVKY